MNTVLDRSSLKPAILSQSSKTINSFLEGYGMTDVWWFLNPSSKTFSFFPPVHHTYSRIDYFIIDNKLIPQVKSSLYDSIIISDHAPVILELALSGYGRISHVWIMNALLLSDGYFVEFISEKNFHFFWDKHYRRDFCSYSLGNTQSLSALRNNFLFCLYKK